jgi:hypothetical protein
LPAARDRSSRDEEILPFLGQDEAVAFGSDGQAAGDQVRELHRRVLLAPHPGNLTPPLEVVEPLPEGLLRVLADAKGLDQVLEGEDPAALPSQAFQDLGLARQHAREST